MKSLKPLETIGLLITSILMPTTSILPDELPKSIEETIQAADQSNRPNDNGITDGDGHKRHENDRASK